ncbi:hypothetical protein Ndes2437B_g01968 [Nannochloris sp. 'desiccata']|nr:hypothetical protein KSW81_006987 [Chlorella desiccata (nom. nud.)]
METINLLRIELAEEVATLPEALRSSYPDLAVDFLYTVFKETASNPIERLPASALEEALASTEAVDLAPRPFPSEERLKAAMAFADGIEADAAELAKQSALSTDAFASLLAHREPASGDSCEGSLSGLVKCQRCSKLMFSSVKAHHATLCKIRQAVAATGARAAGGPHGAPPSDSEWQQPSFDSGIDGHGGSKGRKRRHQQSYDNNLFPPPPVAKSRFSRDSSHRSGSLSSQQAPPPPIDTTTTGGQYLYDTSTQPPLSPMLAAAAGLRQGRSAPSRERRRQLAYLPNQDLKEPLILNRSPVRLGGGRPGGGADAVDGPVPLRLASQNSEELKNRTGSGPVAALAVPVPVPPQQQQQGPRVLSAQQAQQVYQHMQQLRAMQGAGAVVAAMAAPSGLQPHQQQMYIALPPQVQQQFAAQMQYAQQLRQQHQLQQEHAANGRGPPGAPVLQGGGRGGGGTFSPVNGLHQTYNTVNAAIPASAVPAVMYHQFVPSSVGSGFVHVQQHPTVPQ